MSQFFKTSQRTVLPLIVCLAVLFSFFISGCSSNSNTGPVTSPGTDTSSSSNPVPSVDKNTFVGRNGKLQVIGTQLCNENKEPVQLIGMSSMSLNLYGRFVNKDTLQWLRDDWGVNVFRAAMYTEEGGYIANQSIKEKVKEAVQAAIDLGIYVIIDWHILSDGDPNKYKEQSKEFFKEMSSLYGNYPNVIYEICNEPNGDNVKWANSIKPYAEEVIPVIRQSAPDSIILVGTATWSQEVHDAADNPLSFDNIMYVCHFYAGTHGSWLRDRIDYALGKGAPIFVSEWGTSQANGSDGVFLEESLQWINFLNERKISWVNWSLCDKDESSAALTSTASSKGGWTDNDLTESGLFVKYSILNKDQYTLLSEGFETNMFTTRRWDSKGSMILNKIGSSGYYGALLKKDNYIAKSLRTKGFSNIKLQFSISIKDFGADDHFLIEWFDGSNWATLEDINKSSDWTEKTFTLPDSASNNENFKIRFSANIKSESAKALLDEIKIIGDKAVK
ncbi:MAG: glycoside hydrolase family 5 protein [Bacillota bacterium]